MVACISLNPFLIEETVTTLNYACRAQGIQKKIEKNYNFDEVNEDMMCLKCKKELKYNSEELPKETLTQSKVAEKNLLFEQIYEDIV